ncbi:hypothetical protein AEM51_07790 [Bacteroidetes bacterium UKL13-3]|jgi:hypothetical protein|nr:hypothetical protein AEM51_07790 [Bacteroidetes bacterium UKL13-3]HCP93535.1 hypothetical protein [Bacteroidota bacterium]
METKVHLTDLHTERQTWLKAMALSKDEIQSFENRLSEIVKANNQVEVTSMVEHFQNQFILQREVMDILIRDINASEAAMAKQVEANPVATEHKTAPDHVDLRDRAETFTNLFAELKAEFNKFAAKTL